MATNERPAVEHTAGPWATDGVIDLEGGFSVIAIDREIGLRTPTRGAVAFVYGQHFASFNDPEIGRANARLIAAAPQLLAIVRDMLEEPNHPRLSVVSAALNLIAKIEGRSDE